MRGIRHLLTVLQDPPGATAGPPSAELVLASAAAARSGGANLASVSLDWLLPFTAVFPQQTSADRLPSTVRMRKACQPAIGSRSTERGLVAVPPPAFQARWGVRSRLAWAIQRSPQGISLTEPCGSSSLQRCIAPSLRTAEAEGYRRLSPLSHLRLHACDLQTGP